MRSLEEIRKSLVVVHKESLAEALMVARLNVAKMSRGLGISRGTAYKYLVKYFGDDFISEIYIKKYGMTKNTKEDLIRLSTEE